MKNVFKTIFSFVTIMGLALILVAPSAEAVSTVDSKQITSTVTTLSGPVNGSIAHVCLRGPGNAFSYNPGVAVNISNGDRLERQSMAPGDCRLITGISSGSITVQASVSRTPGLGTYYFDLKS